MEREIRHLKQELALHDVLSKKGASSGEAFTAEKQYEVQTVANDFLTGKIEDIEFLGSVRMVKEYLRQMKTSYIKLTQESANLLETHSAHHSDKVANVAASKAQSAFSGNGVGVEEKTGQFSLGKAPRDFKPITKIEISKDKEKEIAAMQEWEDYSE